VFPLRFVRGQIQSAPGIQRIVNLKLPFDVLQAIRKTQALAHGNGFETGGQRVSFQMIAVRGPDDRGPAQQRLVNT